MVSSSFVLVDRRDGSGKCLENEKKIEITKKEKGKGKEKGKVASRLASH